MYPCALCTGCPQTKVYNLPFGCGGGGDDVGGGAGSGAIILFVVKILVL